MWLGGFRSRFDCDLRHVDAVTRSVSFLLELSIIKEACSSLSILVRSHWRLWQESPKSRIRRRASKFGGVRRDVNGRQNFHIAVDGPVQCAPSPRHCPHIVQLDEFIVFFIPIFCVSPVFGTYFYATDDV